MKQNLNYTTALPDFLAMQRISFCWFLNQGLTEELSFFSRIQDFTQNTEYILFGNEYQLVKPSYTVLIGRKYSGNYQAQVVLPVGVRFKIFNVVIFQNQFSRITFPLMTNEATFIVNGCERVIVSQIIRSPGIYFEKNKNQKRKNPFKRTSSTDISKLRSFIPSGEAFISERDLFFALPTVKYNINTGQKRTIPAWEKELIFYYSIKYFKKTKISQSFQFLKSFKLYQIILGIVQNQEKQQLIGLFFKWLQLKNKVFAGKTNLTSPKIHSLIHYFNFLLKVLIKYEIIQFYFSKDESWTKKNFPNLIKLNPTSFLWNDFYFSSNQMIDLFSIYDKFIRKSQNRAHFKLNVELLLMIKQPHEWLMKINQFSFFNQEISQKISNLIEIREWMKFSNLRPTIYFSITLKDQLRYPPKKAEFDEEVFSSLPKEDRHEYFEYLEESSSLPDEYRHKYLKKKSQFLLYRQDHEIKSSYHQKYDEKELYTATLIPDYGSWIRFGFQKNTKINAYKYPVKNLEDEVMIQLDKITQKSVISFFQEMGFTDLEISQSLEHAEFFYFNRPLLVNSKRWNQPLSRFYFTSTYLKNISEFGKIFDPTYYRLGRVGRLKINDRLNLKMSKRLQTITYEDIFAIIDKLISLSISKSISDDIDHLKNRRVRSVGELLQNLFRITFQRLGRKVKNQTNKVDSEEFITLDLTSLNASIREFFGSSQLSQYLDETNPLASLTHRRRISALGPGGLDRDQISFAVRSIHPSHYGRICPIETPEGKNVGLVSSLASCARVNKSGFLETPFWRVINGKVIKTGNPIYLTAEIEDFYKIAPADIGVNPENYLMKNRIPVRYKQDFLTVSPYEVDFISISPIQIVSIAASLIPFFEHDDANRALMGSNMQRQSVPLMFPQKPIVGTGLENQIAIDSGSTLNAQFSGIVNSVTANEIIITDSTGKKLTYKLEKYLRSNQKTCINQRPIVWKGEKVKSGQILTDGPAITNSELSLGQNVLVAYMPWQGYNFEDAILISERLIYDDIFTSIHLERYQITIDETSDKFEQITKEIPNLNPSKLKHLNDDGIVKEGSFVKPGDILVGKVIANDTSEEIPEVSFLRAIFGAKAKEIKDDSYRLPDGYYGRIIETVSLNRKRKSTYQFNKISIFLAQMRKIKVGDKMAGRHGNKGIISRILPRQDMPFLPDGTPIDIILNPLGVPSRMNVGQLYECLLGLAGDKLNSRFKILPFDEMYGVEMSRILINKKLRQASIAQNESWLFNPYAPGKMVLIDGRTGIEFENPVTVGNAYMLKLIHLVDDKMHARATGPYSIITQQPLRGKSHQGGQRFGEMEVWALEGFGAAFTLHELLTVKSDDMDGRVEILNAIVKGEKIPKFGIPESFKVLLQELRSIGLDITTYKMKKFSSSPKYEVEVNLMENYNPFSKKFSPISDLNDISFNDILFE